MAYRNFEEGEDSYLKCLPLIPRQGKKILLLLVAVNVVVIWFIYKRSDYISYFSRNSIQVTTNSVYAPLYNVPVFHIPLLFSKDMVPYYAEVTPNTWCLYEGTDLRESKRHQKCICLPYWFGLDCGIPSPVWKSLLLQEGKNAGVEIRRRDKPRRIILSIVCDDDTFDLLDINIRNSFSVVDIFLVGEEQNHTESAFNKFKKGYLSEFQNKIMPVQIHKRVLDDEHKRISTMLNDLWSIGWSRLSDFRPDDIFVFSQMSSIISKDILLFLKLYDGYPEPFYFTLRPLLFKFSKILKSSHNNNTFVPFNPAGCTFQFIATMCKYSVSEFLSKGCMTKSHQLFFERKHWALKEWTIGDEKFPSGWQCNFCCSNKCIQKKIKKRKWIEKISALLSLNPHYVNASVLEQILKQKSFKSNDISCENILQSDLYFAPKIVINSNRYLYFVD